jgi:serine/threonine protein kinase
VFIKPAAGTLKLRLPLTRLSGRLIPPSDIDLDRYKAPETLQGIVSKETDIWALGIILLQLVTGSAPFGELKTPFELIRALSAFQLPESLGSVEPPELSELIRSCLGQADRRPTVDDLLNHELLNAHGALDAPHPHVRPNPSGDKSIEILVGKE